MVGDGSEDGTIKDMGSPVSLSHMHVVRCSKIHIFLVGIHTYIAIITTKPQVHLTSLTHCHDRDSSYPFFTVNDVCVHPNQGVLRSCESHHKFASKSTHIIHMSHRLPCTHSTSRDPLVAANIQRREERCRCTSGISMAVVLIPCEAMSQVVPVEVDPPAKVP